MCGEETGRTLRCMAVRCCLMEQGGNRSFSVFSEWIGLYCDGVHNKVRMLNCKDLTLLMGMKGSESSPGMGTLNCREQFHISK